MSFSQDNRVYSCCICNDPIGQFISPDVIGYDRFVQLCSQSEKIGQNLASSNTLICKRHWKITYELDSNDNFTTCIDIITGLDIEGCSKNITPMNDTACAIPLHANPSTQEDILSEDLYTQAKRSNRRGKPWSLTKDKNSKMHYIRDYLLSKIGSDKEQEVFIEEYTRKYKLSVLHLDPPSWFLMIMKLIYSALEKSSKFILLFCLLVSIDKLGINLTRSQIVNVLGISWSTLEKAVKMKGKVRHSCKTIVFIPLCSSTHSNSRLIWKNSQTNPK